MYRDDRDALLFRLEAVTRENDQLRARNAKLERPAPPSPATSFDVESFLEDEPPPHQTLRGHAPAWRTARRPAPHAAPRDDAREITRLFAVITFAAVVTLCCFLLLIL